MPTQPHAAQETAQSTLAKRLRDETNLDITQGLRFQLEGWPLLTDSTAKHQRAMMQLQKCLDASAPQQPVVQRPLTHNWNLRTEAS